jgi:hypothetical protein
MGNALCYRCGQDKPTAFVTCGACGATPRSTAELELCCAISQPLATPELVEQYRQDFAAGRVPRPAPALAQRAATVVRMLQERGSLPREAPQQPLRTTALHRSPFYIIGATTRDNRKRIRELALQGQGLGEEHAAREKAESELTNPRTRLAAELAWLPAVAPGRTQQLITGLSPARAIAAQDGLPALARANLIAASLELLDIADLSSLTAAIEALVLAVDQVTPDAVLRELNEDRAVSGFPEIKPVDLERQLGERRRGYGQAVREVLNRLPAPSIVEVLDTTVSRLTADGTRHPPLLVEELVNTYEIEAQGFLEREATGIEKLLERAKSSAASGEHHLTPIIGAVEAVLRNYARIARPILLSARARGIEHAHTRKLASTIRGASVGLYRDHDALDATTRLNGALSRHLAVLPAVAEMTATDAKELQEIAATRKLQEPLKPIDEQCKAACKLADATPERAAEAGGLLLSRAPELLDALRKTGGSLTQDGSERLADALLRCAIAYGNKTSNWKGCLHLVEASLKYATSAKLKERIQKNLAIVRKNTLQGNLKPVTRAPSLFTLNGIGAALYGSSDHDPENGSYLTTHYFVFFFFPVFPMARYRVIRDGNRYRFLGRAPLGASSWWHLGIAVGTISLFFINGAVNG